MQRFPRVNTSALDAANYILDLAGKDGLDIDPITLQKILFYCQCWSLREGHRLFDDAVEAWKHGPVVRSVWKAHSGHSKIRPADEPRYFDLDPQQMDLVRSVWEALKGTHGFVLSKLTHEPGTAWRNARRDLPDTAPSGHELSLEDMATEAARIQESAQKALSDSWDDVVRCAQ